MAIRVKAIGNSAFSVSGFDAARLAKVKREVNRCARAMQRNIYNLFETSRYAGGALLPNSPEYNLRKVLSGYDPRRGHRTGALASALKSQRLWRMSANNKRIVVRFSSSLIGGTAGAYARHYESQKAPLGLLSLLPRWLRECEGKLRRAESAVTPRRDRQTALPARLLTAAIRVATRPRDLGERITIGG